MSVVVEARDLAYCEDGTSLLQELEFQIQQGEVYAFFGPPGSGKTILLSLLYGDLMPSRGQLFLFGLDSQQNWQQTRQRMALVPQGDIFDDEFTVFDNLLTYAGYLGIESPSAEHRILELLRALELDSRSGHRVDQLTRVQKVRLAIARSLLHEPKILFMDEPTRHLSQSERQTIWSYLRGLNRQGLTIILTTDRAEEVEELAQRATLLKEGHCLLADRVEELHKGLAGSLVVEISCSPVDMAYLMEQLRPEYQFFVVNNKVLVYLRPDQDPRDIFSHVAGDQLNIRKTNFHDIYQRAANDWEVSA